MRTLRGRLIRSNIGMFIIVAMSIIIITAVVMMIYAINTNPQDISRLEQLIKIIEMDQESMNYLIAWFILVLSSCVGSTLYFTMRTTHSLTYSLNEIIKAMGQIIDGNLDFDMLTSQDWEIAEICGKLEIMRQKLKDAEESKRCLDEQRRMLINNLAHDMRTPVSAILGYAEGLRDGVADTAEKREKYLNTIISKIHSIEELLSDMTELSEIELGRQVFRIEYLDICAMVDELADSYEQEVTNAGLKFSRKLPEYPLKVAVDRGKLTRALNNLINNAIKYNSPGGKVEISIERDGKYVEICVSDTGSGIRPEESKRIFEAFYRGDKSRSGRIKGSGLGLAISRSVIEGMGGKIWARGENGKGAEFCILLQIREETGDLM